MKSLLTIFIVLLFLSCKDSSTTTPCEDENIGYLIVKNGLTGDQATPLDIYIGDLFKQRIAPQEETKIIELIVASYRLEGVDTIDVRTFGKNINIMPCEKLEITLGE